MSYNVPVYLCIHVSTMVHGGSEMLPQCTRPIHPRQQGYKAPWQPYCSKAVLVKAVTASRCIDYHGNPGFLVIHVAVD